MALQSQKRTKSSKKRRASHFALTKINLSQCSHCHQPVQPHHACANCGYYKGKEVIKQKSAMTKKGKT
ncbi:MAG: 50S ribosomal protein L32 [Parcubacteria group bacterium GW2011_GWA2_43_17]|nr:MAG: 50S ribosomal protein L32 [Parcubacteria group bacterium GW2011_GWA2_43_17]KKT92841.1 MAG: 50S ribosomal protein L32 [Parcubacteria group bacterium GW2011_GWF2_45_11]KKT98039.1 MAG: 50S ribosomal protein L32 [Parcubacteria group bacterium GW2011_GWC2_45_15]OGY94941.1 MAG: 50S ribosomal protein L32 [Candidatus Komeilibacteria bacterium RIFOXYC2_FULL_45_12]OGY94959.1 MAG: 50S ribosomal protein L32 [Candidatus Komeilibacteria bacterium RIFOXYA2_FULL_45_9]HAH04346.1 50S ribosomal protein L